MIPETEDEIVTLFEEYASGFDDFDGETVADCFAYPCTIWQFGKGNVFVDRVELMENIEALLSVYEREEIVHSAFDVTVLQAADGVAMATLAWRLEREDGDVALAYGCHYALIDGHDGWRIATVFNEAPQEAPQAPEDPQDSDEYPATANEGE